MLSEFVSSGRKLSGGGWLQGVPGWSPGSDWKAMGTALGKADQRV